MDVDPNWTFGASADKKVDLNVQKYWNQFDSWSCYGWGTDEHLALSLEYFEHWVVTDNSTSVPLHFKVDVLEPLLPKLLLQFVEHLLNIRLHVDTCPFLCVIQIDERIQQRQEVIILGILHVSGLYEEKDFK